MSGVKSNGGVPIKARIGMSLTTEKEQLERLEHFSKILNQDEPDILFDLWSERARKIVNVNLRDISLEEVRSALQKLKSNKAAGADETQPELLKYGDKTVEIELLHLFSRIWKLERIPSDQGQGNIVTIPKKGDVSEYNNWRGVPLLSIQGKVSCSGFVKVKSKLDVMLQGEQAGFRYGRLFT